MSQEGRMENVHRGKGIERKKLESRLCGRRTKRK